MKTKIKLLSFILLISCTGEDSQPKETTIDGKVVYEDTEEPAEGVLVKLMSSKRSGSAIISLIETEDSLILDSYGQFYFKLQYESKTVYSLKIRYMAPSNNYLLLPKVVDCTPACESLRAGEEHNFLIKISRDTL